MTDQWFLQDIRHLVAKRNRVVILDPMAKCEFLLPLLNGEACEVLKTDSRLIEQWQSAQEELLLRYQAETKHKDKAVVFYTTRPSEKLSFLFDYCHTHGCLDLSNPYEWLRKKIFSNTGMQISLDNPMLLTAAKLGIGKNVAWWKKVLQNLEDLVSLNEELLPFLNNPESFLKSKDPDVRRLFEEKLSELLGRPYMKKPPKTIASEVAAFIFDGLAANEISEDLLSLYYKWVDSETYSQSLADYLSSYKLGDDANPWSAHPDHCFKELDKEALRQICENISNKKFIYEKLVKVRQRTLNTKVRRLIPYWWFDIITLLEYDPTPITNCNNFKDIVEFYTQHFHKVDRAVRNLYENFLHEQPIMRPLQEYYEGLNREVLQKWFEYAGQYKSDQQGFLVNLLKNAKPLTAVIVGDGVRYEIAEFVAKSLEKHYRVDRKTMLADMPSETEHNMSALYVGNNEAIAIHKHRGKKLAEITGRDIRFMSLEAVDYGLNADYLVLTYKDIDDTGEKLQHGALKLFKEFEKVMKEKIDLLLKIGYKEVHLVTDHGFVLTGLLDESDKIEPAATGEKEVHERFIRTVEKPSDTDWITFERPYGKFSYVAVAKNHRPFKSRGMYGFSHGGFTPQEVIIPNFVFRQDDVVVTGLGVNIANKAELSDVAGDNFGLKIMAAEATSDLFASVRKIKIILYSDNINFSSSSIITINAGTTHSLEFSFEGHKKVSVVVVDADTQEQLDSARVNKSEARDMGGLM